MSNKKKCKQCGVIFYKKYHHSKKYWKTARYCSPRCGSLGKHNKLGKTGYKHTEDARRRIGDASRGEKNKWWKGGKSTLKRQIINCFEYRQWRSDVFTRDGFMCQHCDKKGCYLEAHHIKGFSEIVEEYNIKKIDDALKCVELWNINNGLTLCKKCHSKTDNFGGNGMTKK